jgi:hypothetical protein
MLATMRKIEATKAYLYQLRVERRWMSLGFGARLEKKSTVDFFAWKIRTQSRRETENIGLKIERC